MICASLVRICRIYVDTSYYYVDIFLHPQSYGGYRLVYYLISMHISCALKDEDVHVRIYDKFFAHNTKLNWKAENSKTFWMTAGLCMPGRHNGMYDVFMDCNHLTTQDVRYKKHHK